MQKSPLQTSVVNGDMSNGTRCVYVCVCVWEGGCVCVNMCVLGYVHMGVCMCLGVLCVGNMGVHACRCGCAGVGEW